MRSSRIFLIFVASCSCELYCLVALALALLGDISFHDYNFCLLTLSFAFEFMFVCFSTCYVICYRIHLLYVYVCQRVIKIVLYCFAEDKEDIYFFEMNSFNVLKISVYFMSAYNTSKISDVFNTCDEIFLVFTEKSNFLLIFRFEKKNLTFFLIISRTFCLAQRV